MSRAGKYPVEYKDGVSIEIVGTNLVVKGPKGEIKVRLDTKNAGLVDIKIEADQVTVIPKDEEDKASRAMWGTMARNIKAAVIGVMTGFEKAIYMKGVGYKASVKGNELVLVAGYSHDVVLQIPAGLTVEMGAAPTEFTVKGIDKVAVGLFADKIRKVRKADPYKGKGIFYKGEKVRRKEGKKK
ncbi:MAG: 50S ribosomal protein L6 [Rickettsiales bacterium]|jgi:large subunit ribosomal protein L6|nr:50S ribosomal protein L6 [Rickettsiales bacterium]